MSDQKVPPLPFVVNRKLSTGESGSPRRLKRTEIDKLQDAVTDVWLSADGNEPVTLESACDFHGVDMTVVLDAGDQNRYCLVPSIFFEQRELEKAGKS